MEKNNQEINKLLSWNELKTTFDNFSENTKNKILTEYKSKSNWLDESFRLNLLLTLILWEQEILDVSKNQTTVLRDSLDDADLNKNLDKLYDEVAGSYYQMKLNFSSYINSTNTDEEWQVAFEKYIEENDAKDEKDLTKNPLNTEFEDFKNELEKWVKSLEEISHNLVIQAKEIKESKKEWTYTVKYGDVEKPYDTKEDALIAIRDELELLNSLDEKSVFFETKILEFKNLLYFAPFLLPRLVQNIWNILLMPFKWEDVNWKKSFLQRFGSKTGDIISSVWKAPVVWTIISNTNLWLKIEWVKSLSSLLVTETDLDFRGMDFLDYYSYWSKWQLEKRLIAIDMFEKDIKLFRENWIDEKSIEKMEKSLQKLKDKFPLNERDRTFETVFRNAYENIVFPEIEDNLAKAKWEKLWKYKIILNGLNSTFNYINYFQWTNRSFMDDFIKTRLEKYKDWIGELYSIEKRLDDKWKIVRHEDWTIEVEAKPKELVKHLFWENNPEIETYLKKFRACDLEIFLWWIDKKDLSKKVVSDLMNLKKWASLEEIKNGNLPEWLKSLYNKTEIEDFIEETKKEHLKYIQKKYWEIKDNTNISEESKKIKISELKKDYENSFDSKKDWNFIDTIEQNYGIEKKLNKEQKFKEELNWIIWENNNLEKLSKLEKLKEKIDIELKSEKSEELVNILKDLKKSYVDILNEEYKEEKIKDKSYYDLKKIKSDLDEKVNKMELWNNLKSLIDGINKQYLEKIKTYYEAEFEKSKEDLSKLKNLLNNLNSDLDNTNPQELREIRGNMISKIDELGKSINKNEKSEERQYNEEQNDKKRQQQLEDEKSRREHELALKKLKKWNKGSWDTELDELWKIETWANAGEIRTEIEREVTNFEELERIRKEIKEKTRKLEVTDEYKNELLERLEKLWINIWEISNFAELNNKLENEISKQKWKKVTTSKSVMEKLKEIKFKK